MRAVGSATRSPRGRRCGGARAASRREFSGERYQLISSGGARIVTWVQDGHTCILASRTAPARRRCSHSPRPSAAPPPDPSDTVQRHGPRRRLHRRRDRARRRQAVIPVTDQGLIRGDGVFEVIRLYDGRPYALDAHLARLERSAAGLRLPLEVDAVRADALALLARRARGATSCCGCMVTRGGRRIALIEPMPEVPASIALEPIIYGPTRMLDGIKSLSYGANMLASRLARERGADDALLVTPHGRLLECPTASFFLVRDGEFVDRAARRPRARLDHAPRRARRRRAFARSRSSGRARGRRGGLRRLQRPRGRAACTASAPREYPAPGRAHARARGARARADPVRAAPDADRDGGRQPPAVRQGGRRLRAAARAPRGGADPHRAAPRRRALGGLLR